MNRAVVCPSHGQDRYTHFAYLHTFAYEDCYTFLGKGLHVTWGKCQGKGKGI